ncbi:hypothetical protein DYD21_03805 [Rhodohalobacter sp. SW132]|uniref:hypothetical protein n=1 Tax=Rhodohalobacter sp. SW132 TaxID=2293433 RepID=UPI000E26B96C|nr:hypothetical protein [Rhodohalobacter sp. SW132]REL39092.1 hypothetical protein DYD21_03805 [Rhodohalobacter sp. SW132]
MHNKNYHIKLIEVIRWILSIAILIHAAGLFATVFEMRQTQFGNYLFMVMGMPHGDALFYERITVSAFLFLCLVNLFHTRMYTLLPIAAYILFEAWAGYYQAAYRYSEFTLYAHVMRYMTPVVLVVLCTVPFRKILSEKARLLSVEWLLRISLAVLFFIHGLEAWLGHPVFADLIIGSANNLAGVRITESMAVQIMKGIGILDLIVVLGLLFKPLQGVLFWALFWGALTAFSRITAIGSTAYIEVLLRASHILAPFALWAIMYQPAWIVQAVPIQSLVSRGKKHQLST